MQAIPQYHGTTTFIITADHGRGSGLSEWKEHGVEEKGSENIWIAVMGPDTAPLGERSHIAPVTQSQIAATVAALVGKDYTAAVPRAAQPIAPVLTAAAPAERLGTVSFAVSCSPVGAGAVQPGRRTAARFLVRRGAAAIRGHCQGRPRVRHRTLGNGDEHLSPDMGPARRGHDGPRQGRAAKGGGACGEERARARVHRRPRPLLCTGHARLSGADRRLFRGHGHALPALSQRCRRRSVLRAVAARRRGAGRHQPRPATQGACGARSAVEAIPRPSGARALHHSRLRHARARARRIGRGPALRRHRTLRSTCRAHAGSYLCAARHVAGRHRRQSRLGGGLAGRAEPACERRHGSVPLG